MQLYVTDLRFGMSAINSTPLAVTHSNHRASGGLISQAGALPRVFVPLTGTAGWFATRAQRRRPRSLRKHAIRQVWADAGSEGPALEGPPEGSRTVQVRFQVPAFRLAGYGDTLRVCGEAAALGIWSVAAAPRMRWEVGDNWSVTLPLAPGWHDFKLVRVCRNGAVHWEKGPNRRIEVPDDITSMLVTVASGQPTKAEGVPEPDAVVEEAQRMLEELTREKYSLRTKVGDLEKSLQERDARLNHLMGVLDSVDNAEPDQSWAQMEQTLASQLTAQESLRLPPVQGGGPRRPPEGAPRPPANRPKYGPPKKKAPGDSTVVEPTAAAAAAAGALLADATLQAKEDGQTDSEQEQPQTEESAAEDQQETAAASEIAAEASAENAEGVAWQTAEQVQRDIQEGFTAQLSEEEPLVLSSSDDGTVILQATSAFANRAQQVLQRLEDTVAEAANVLGVLGADGQQLLAAAPSQSASSDGSISDSIDDLDLSMKALVDQLEAPQVAGPLPGPAGPQEGPLEGPVADAADSSEVFSTEEDVAEQPSEQKLGNEEPQTEQGSVEQLVEAKQLPEDVAEEVTAALEAVNASAALEMADSSAISDAPEYISATESGEDPLTLVENTPEQLPSYNYESSDSDEETTRAAATESKPAAIITGGILPGIPSRGVGLMPFAKESAAFAQEAPADQPPAYWAQQLEGDVEGDEDDAEEGPVGAPEEPFEGPAQIETAAVSVPQAVEEIRTDRQTISLIDRDDIYPCRPSAALQVLIRADAEKRAAAVLQKEAVSILPRSLASVPESVLASMEDDDEARTIPEEADEQPQEQPQKQPQAAEAVLAQPDTKANSTAAEPDSIVAEEYVQAADATETGQAQQTIAEEIVLTSKDEVQDLVLSMGDLLGAPEGPLAVPDAQQDEAVAEEVTADSAEAASAEVAPQGPKQGSSEGPAQVEEMVLTSADDVSDMVLPLSEIFAEAPAPAAAVEASLTDPDAEELLETAGYTNGNSPSAVPDVSAEGAFDFVEEVALTSQDVVEDIVMDLEEVLDVTESSVRPSAAPQPNGVIPKDPEGVLAPSNAADNGAEPKTSTVETSADEVTAEVEGDDEVHDLVMDMSEVLGTSAAGIPAAVGVDGITLLPSDETPKPSSPLSEQPDYAADVSAEQGSEVVEEIILTSSDEIKDVVMDMDEVFAAPSQEVLPVAQQEVVSAQDGPEMAPEMAPEEGPADENALERLQTIRSSLDSELEAENLVVGAEGKPLEAAAAADSTADDTTLQVVASIDSALAAFADSLRPKTPVIDTAALAAKQTISGDSEAAAQADIQADADSSLAPVSHEDTPAAVEADTVVVSEESISTADFQVVDGVSDAEQAAAAELLVEMSDTVSEAHEEFSAEDVLAEISEIVSDRNETVQPSAEDTAADVSDALDQAETLLREDAAAVAETLGDESQSGEQDVVSLKEEADEIARKLKAYEEAIARILSYEPTTAPGSPDMQTPKPFTNLGNSPLLQQFAPLGSSSLATPEGQTDRRKELVTSEAENAISEQIPEQRAAEQLESSTVAGDAVQQQPQISAAADSKTEKLGIVDSETEQLQISLEEAVAEEADSSVDSAASRAEMVSAAKQVAETDDQPALTAAVLEELEAPAGPQEGPSEGPFEAIQLTTETEFMVEAEQADIEQPAAAVADFLDVSTEQSDAVAVEDEVAAKLLQEAAEETEEQVPVAAIVADAAEQPAKVGESVQEDVLAVSMAVEKQQQTLVEAQQETAEQVQRDAFTDATEGEAPATPEGRKGPRMVPIPVLRAPGSAEGPMQVVSGVSQSADALSIARASLNRSLLESEGALQDLEGLLQDLDAEKEQLRQSASIFEQVLQEKLQAVQGGTAVVPTPSDSIQTPEDTPAKEVAVADAAKPVQAKESFLPEQDSKAQDDEEPPAASPPTVEETAFEAQTEAALEAAEAAEEAPPAPESKFKARVAELLESPPQPPQSRGPTGVLDPTGPPVIAPANAFSMKGMKPKTPAVQKAAAEATTSAIQGGWFGKLLGGFMGGKQKPDARPPTPAAAPAQEVAPAASPKSSFSDSQDDSDDNYPPPSAKTAAPEGDQDNDQDGPSRGPPRGLSGFPGPSFMPGPSPPGLFGSGGAPEPFTGAVSGTVGGRSGSQLLRSPSRGSAGAPEGPVLREKETQMQLGASEVEEQEIRDALQQSSIEQWVDSQQLPQEAAQEAAYGPQQGEAVSGWPFETEAWEIRPPSPSIDTVPDRYLELQEGSQAPSRAGPLPSASPQTLQRGPGTLQDPPDGPPGKLPNGEKLPIGERIPNGEKKPNGAAANGSKVKEQTDSARAEAAREAAWQELRGFPAEGPRMGPVSYPLIDADSESIAASSVEAPINGQAGANAASSGLADQFLSPEDFASAVYGVIDTVSDPLFTTRAPQQAPQGPQGPQDLRTEAWEAPTVVEEAAIEDLMDAVSSAASKKREANKPLVVSVVKALGITPVDPESRKLYEMLTGRKYSEDHKVRDWLARSLAVADAKETEEPQFTPMIETYSSDEDEAGRPKRSLQQLSFNNNFVATVIITAWVLLWESGSQLVYQPLREKLVPKDEMQKQSQAVYDIVAVTLFALGVIKAFKE